MVKQQRSRSSEHQQDTGHGSVGSDSDRSPGVHSGPAVGVSGPGDASSGADPGEIVRDGKTVTTHRDVGPSDAVNATEPEAGECVEEEARIEVKADAGSPFRVEGDATPTEADLFRRVEGEGPGQAVTSFDGTLSGPNISEQADDSTVFIGGTPTIDDIHQASFADCYFLASLGSVTAADPGYITGTVVSGEAGENVTINLFSWDTSTNAWTAAPIQVSKKLISIKEGDNAGRLVGAGFRVADAPKASDWWVEVEGDTARVHRKNTLELALWAPLVEKAYASYTQQFGQYGGRRTAAGLSEGGASATSGYDGINGGIADLTYGILYGNSASYGATNVNAGPGTDLVTTNLPAIRNLLRLSGEGVSAGNEFVMTAALSRDEAVDRLDSYLQSFIGSDLIKKYKSLKAPFERTREVIDTWDKETDADKKKKKLGNVSKYAGSICKPGAYPALHYETSEKELKDLNEQLNIVALIQTDHSTGQRFTYAWHSYSILGADFRDGEGKDLALTMATLAANAANIDEEKSSVDLRNPHGKNSPNEHGTADQSEDDGNFSLSLDQFFRSFSFQQHGVVPTSGP